MATVYLARQTDLDRDVALKELNVVDGADPRVARRFLREARLAGSLSHPNIVTVHDFFQFGGKPYIAMEYIARGALRPYVGRMSLPQVGGVLEGMLAALAYAEDRGIVHRDLKPENVMVTAEGGVKVADFGIAKATSAVKEPTLNLTATGTTLGTPNYIAPEQAMALELGPGTDLYSLGVMAFEFFTGLVPFHDTEEPVAIAMRHVNEAIPPVITLRPDADPALSAWIERLLVKDPAGRTASAALAADELEEIMLDASGPRWRRDAPLPVRPGARAAQAVAAAAPPRPSRSFRTMAPSTRRRPPTATTLSLAPEPAQPMRGNRARTTALAVLALIAVVALLTGFLSGGKGSSQPGQPTPAAGAGSSTPAATAPTTTSPTTTTSPAPTTTTPAPQAPARAQAPAASGSTPPPAASGGRETGDEASDDPSDDAPESGSP